MSRKESVKQYLKKHPAFSKLVFHTMNHFRYNSFHIGNNELIYDSCRIIHSNIEIHGTNNKVLIEDGSTLKNCHIVIYGNQNEIHVSKNCFLSEAELWIEDDHNRIEIGEHTAIYGSTQLAAIEGTTIKIGEDCMFSSDIEFRTGDSHSITDLEGNRINPSEDILIGDHCWIGTRVICLKGVIVPDHCVIGAGTVVSEKFNQEHCVIAGVPAKIIKTGVDWKKQRI